MVDDLVRRAEMFAEQHATTPVQNALLQVAFQGLRTRLNELSASPDSLDCIRIPRLVYAAVRGDDALPVPLTTALVLAYAGIRLFDDLMDGELPIIWQGHGSSEVILAAATFLSALAPLAVTAIAAPAATRVALQRTLARGLLVMAAGQHNDVTLSDLGAATPELVEAIVNAKSGEAVAIFAEMAALLAEAPPETVVAYAEMGRALGTAWQIRSDLHDLFIATHSADLTNGTRTLPIALYVATLPDGERQHFAALLEQARTDAAAQESVRTCLQGAGAARNCAVLVEVYCQRATSALTRARPREPGATGLRDLVKTTSFF